jgi:hypothetical protein
VQEIYDEMEDDDIITPKPIQVEKHKGDYEDIKHKFAPQTLT